MTAFAFILGVLPLMFATGAGAASRQSIGTTVFGGMVAATILSLVFVPVFYAVIERLREGRERSDAHDQDHSGQDNNEPTADPALVRLAEAAE
jgi:HAE1 family hydrophobic/amphiphilic exporter-1